MACCREHGLGVHLGIGLGAYEVCNGQDPLDPAVMSGIKAHIEQVIQAWDIAGIEFQTGEYDRAEFQGDAVRTKSHAEQICETLNPYVHHALDLNPSLRVRSELNAEYCPARQCPDVARLLDPRCTVEWSRFTGPFDGPDCYERGRRLLGLAPNFSWFLKIHYRRDQFWKEIGEMPAHARAWIEHWRGWVKLLEDYRRSTLTICHVHDTFPAAPAWLVSAAIALARNPHLSADELIARYFQA